MHHFTTFQVVHDIWVLQRSQDEPDGPYCSAVSSVDMYARALRIQ